MDRQLRPVAPGEASDSVLLTNLANRTQPLLRYQLGDSVRFLTEACACGSGFPAIEVQGRADHTLVLRDARQREVRLLPLALTTVIEEGAQVTRFQLLCTATDRLELRFEAGHRRPVGDLPACACRAVGFPRAAGIAASAIGPGSCPAAAPRHSGKLERVLLQAGTGQRATPPSA